MKHALRPLAALGGLVLLSTSGAALLHYYASPPVTLTHSDPHPGGQPVVSRLGDMADQVVASLPAMPRPATLPAADPAPPSAPRAGMWIEMPDLGVALPVFRGDGSDRVPQWQALVYPGTAQPGAPGSSYVYAHGLWGMFGPLLYARVGDRVELHDYTRGSTVTLHVTRVVGRVSYDDTSWIRLRSSKPLVTLQTCIDDNPHGKRYIVQAG